MQHIKQLSFGISARTSALKIFFGAHMKFKEGFVDLHTHTRYPCTKYFNSKDIEDAAHNGGYNTLLAMPNSEVVIDNINNLKKA